MKKSRYDIDLEEFMEELYPESPEFSTSPEFSSETTSPSSFFLSPVSFEAARKYQPVRFSNLDLYPEPKTLEKKHLSDFDESRKAINLSFSFPQKDEYFFDMKKSDEQPMVGPYEATPPLSKSLLSRIEENNYEPFFRNLKRKKSKSKSKSKSKRKSTRKPLKRSKGKRI
jgi:hypothetical protein